MSTYVVTHTDGTVYTTLGAGVIDSKLGISLIGSNYVGYGQLIANNFVRLLENQANDTPPSYPIAGQLWWNTTKQTLYYYDGNKFKPCSSSELGVNPPLSPLDGDQWWDTTNDQLKVWDGAKWMLIGPGYVKGQGITGIETLQVTDNASSQHLVAKLQLDGNVVAIISNDSHFTLSANIGGINDIKPGINLAANTVINGTSINALQLGGINSNDYVTKSAVSNTLLGSLVVQGLNGVTVGNLSIAADGLGNQHIGSNSSINLSSGNATISVNSVAGTITVNKEPTVPTSVATKVYVDTATAATQGNAYAYVDSSIDTLVNGALLSTLHKVSKALDDDEDYHINTDAKISFKSDAFNPVFDGKISPKNHNTVDIGSSSKRFKTIYCGTVNSTSADLAEKYISDSEYEPGTVVVFGGDDEVTVSKRYCDHRIAGVVSTAPAYLMNEASSGVAVALTGKVPCNVVGPVRKGDILVNSSVPGVAIALGDHRHWVPGCVIGKSLMDDNNATVRTIMVSVGRL